MSATYLLDTGVLFGFALRQGWAVEAHGRLALGDSSVMVVTSHICLGEIYTIANRRKWGTKKMNELDEFVSQIPSVSIANLDIVRAYGELNHWTHGGTGATLVAHPPPKPARTMADNDLWIAASAHCLQAILVSTDKDFLHLDGKWIDFEYVEPA